MWPSLQLVFILSMLLNWHTRQLDFTIAIPQALVEFPLYMNSPKGYERQKISKKMYLPKLSNIYGQ